MWIFIMGRLLSLSIALALIIYSVSWALQGLWDLAIILFVAGIVFFIPFILFIRQIKEIKKLKKYAKRKNAIIGWRHSG
ncbi:MAG: ATP synthase subunit I [Puia sp.]